MNFLNSCNLKQWINAVCLLIYFVIIIKQHKGTKQYTLNLYNVKHNEHLLDRLDEYN